MGMGSKKRYWFFNKKAVHACVGLHRKRETAPRSGGGGGIFNWG